MKRFLVVGIALALVGSLAVVNAQSPEPDIGYDVVDVIKDDVKVASVNIETMDVAVYKENIEVSAFYVDYDSKHYFVGIKTNDRDCECFEVCYSKTIEKHRFKPKLMDKESMYVFKEYGIKSSGGLSNRTI